MRVFLIWTLFLLCGRSGEPAAAGDSVQYDYTLRRANGYFVYATVACGVGCGDGTPEVSRLGGQSGSKLIAGLDELLTGMRPGEKRRALVPPALGYVRRVSLRAHCAAGSS
jgi:FKBP-type peptidyl-prolyl cis-trans isomerase 2